jgi:hypothetical protein
LRKACSDGSRSSCADVPRSVPAGWRTWLLVGVVAITSYAVMMGGGLALRTLTVPLPFTLSSLLVVIALSLLNRSAKRRGLNYVQRVGWSQW